MANLPPIQFKRTHTVGKVPTPAQLATGELALNFADGRIYSKDSDGNVLAMGVGGLGIFAVDSEKVLYQLAKDFDSDKIKHKEFIAYNIQENTLVAWDSDTDTFITIGGSGGAAVEGYFEDFVIKTKTPSVIVTDKDVNGETDPNKIFVVYKGHVLPSSEYNAAFIAGAWNITLNGDSDYAGKTFEFGEFVRVGLAWSITSVEDSLGNSPHYKLQNVTTPKTIFPFSDYYDVTVDSAHPKLFSTKVWRNNSVKIRGVVRGKDLNPLDKNYYWFDSESTTPTRVTDSEVFSSGSYSYEIGKVSDKKIYTEPFRRVHYKTFTSTSPELWNVPDSDRVYDFHFILVGGGGGGSSGQGYGKGGVGGALVFCDPEDIYIKGKQIKVKAGLGAIGADLGWSGRLFDGAKAGVQSSYVSFNLFNRDYKVETGLPPAGVQSFDPSVWEGFAGFEDSEGLLHKAPAGILVQKHYGAEGCDLSAEAFPTGFNGKQGERFYWKQQWFQAPASGGEGKAAALTNGIGATNPIDEHGLTSTGGDGDFNQATNGSGYGGGGGGGGQVGASGGAGSNGVVRFYWRDNKDPITYTEYPIYNFTKTNLAGTTELVRIEKEFDVEAFKNVQATITKTIKNNTSGINNFSNIWSKIDGYSNGTTMAYFDGEWKETVYEYESINVYDSTKTYTQYQLPGLSNVYVVQNLSSGVRSLRILNKTSSSIVMLQYPAGYWEYDVSAGVANIGETTATSFKTVNANTMESTAQYSFSEVYDYVFWSYRITIADTMAQHAANNYKEYDIEASYSGSKQKTHLIIRRLK